MPYTLEEEDQIIAAAAAASEMVEYESIGETVAGRPIWGVRVGSPPPPSVDSQVHVMLTGAQHGNESAGREALLQIIGLLGDGDPYWVSAFTGVQAIIVPTVNRDGVLRGERANGHGVDLNRNWWELSQPETRAVAQVLGSARPYVHVDAHESLNNIDINNHVEYRAPGNPQAYEGVVDESVTLRDRLIGNARDNGWSADVYLPGSLGGLTNLDSQMILRHSVSILIETNRNDGYAFEDRSTIQYESFQEVMEYVNDTVGGLPELRSAAETHVTLVGAAADEPFDIRSTVINPPPIAYQLVGDIPEFHLDVFNIDIGDNGVILMGQSSQPVIPFLFDTESNVQVGNGIRLFSLVDPDPGNTPEQFDDVIRGSHCFLLEARVITSYTTSDNPAGVDVPVISGDVTFDANNDVFGSLSLTTDGSNECNGCSEFPTRPDDLYSVYGHEIFLRRGVDLGEAGVLWSPLGYYRIETVEQAGHSNSVLTITGRDRMAGIIESRPLVPIEYEPGTRIGEIVNDLVRDVYPQATIIFGDPELPQQAIRRTVIAEDSRHDVLVEIAESNGQIIYWDGAGALRIEPPPDEDTPRVYLNTGSNGVLVDSSRRVTREGVYNAVVATGESTDTDLAPVLSIVYDAGENSPTRWGGPFGQVPRFYSSPLISTSGQARSAAESLLRNNLGAPYSVDFGTVPNPGLRPWDTVRIRQKDGNRELHTITSLNIPLTATGVMTGNTREKTPVNLHANSSLVPPRTSNDNGEIEVTDNGGEA
nr:zinc carboxypeptidase [uncultured bacterium]AMP54381.1 zinc carboxypeptidase [uncultured bacterium]AMP54420.1 zinc carboxypeptidase [uncultured bacterium]AMP54461.1 zinc carboxypeptidase [uncultured bacterium]